MNLKRFFIVMILMGSFIVSPIMGAINPSGAANNDNADIEIQVNYSEVQSLPEGGKAYVFYIDGVKNKYLVPPEGFNPLKATDAQLEEYGFQPRPTDAKALAEWEEIMSHYKSTPIPTSLHVKKKYKSVNKIKTDSSIIGPPYETINWSGYQNLSSNWEEFKGVQGRFNQPTLLGGPSNSDASFWVGLGERAEKLIQAGTAMNNNSYYAWYQYIKPGATGSEIKIPNQVIRPNDNILVGVGYLPNNQLAWFSVDNLTTGEFWQMVVENGNDFYDGSSAEWIEERGTLAATGETLPLANYGTVTWNGCKSNDENWNFFNLGSYGYYRRVDMYSDDGQRLLSRPNPLTSDTSFTDVWYGSN